MWGYIENLRFDKVPDRHIEAVSSALGIPFDEIRPLELARQNAAAIEIQFKIVDAERILASRTVDRLTLPSALDSAIESENEGCIRDALSTLTYREREILKLRYGLLEHRGTRHSLLETAKMFCVTRERVRRLEAKAIRKLSESNILRGLHDA